MNFKRFGVMLDCSRNAVMKPDSVKKYIDILCKLNYNVLMLYTEDTFEVENQQYFGYLRGRYSVDEIKEIDKYATEKGIELIPCIQTLAHLDGIVRWKAYRDYRDTADILLAGDERTYKLIDDIFSTLSKSYTSRIVNIGMDEAHMVGLGKYLDENGYHNRTEILLNHLNRVCEIAKKYGFQPIMWSDMFFRLASGGKYIETEFNDDVINSVPSEVGLIYWDYYSKEKSHYDKMIKSHLQFNNEIWFAGGLWTWMGHSPKTGFAIDTIDAAIPSLKENKIDNVIFTLWGDDGKECSYFSALPSLYYAAKKAEGIDDINEIKSGFFDMFGIAFDDFMLTDLGVLGGDKPKSNFNPEKYMFYSDCFYGFLDSAVKKGFVPHFDERAKQLGKLASNNEYGYIFKCLSDLCSFLQIKFTLGIRTREAYKTGDKAKIKSISDDYEKAVNLLENFYNSYKILWLKENKPQGFDVQDIHIGGLIQRLKSCKERLLQYLNGEIEKIEELDEEILPEFEVGCHYINDWMSTASVNIMTHNHKPF